MQFFFLKRPFLASSVTPLGSLAGGGWHDPIVIFPFESSAQR